MCSSDLSESWQPIPLCQPLLARGLPSAGPSLHAAGSLSASATVPSNGSPQHWAAPRSPTARPPGVLRLIPLDLEGFPFPAPASINGRTAAASLPHGASHGASYHAFHPMAEALSRKQVHLLMPDDLHRQVKQKADEAGVKIGRAHV